MIDPAALEAIVAKHTNTLWPQFRDTLLTPGAAGRFRSRLFELVRTEVAEPFRIDVSVDLEFGRITIDARPVLTEAEKRAEEARHSAMQEEYRRSLPPPAPPRLSQAKVVQHDGAYISIDGMIEDLRHWNAPPGLFNEGEAGFDQALNDVIRYLQTRARKAE